MRMLPNPKRSTMTVNGRTYIGAVGVPLDNIPDFDGNVLAANGWTILSSYVDASGSLTAAQLSALIATLPTTLPGSAGTVWNDAGVVSES